MNNSPKETPKPWWVLVIASSGAFVIASLAYVAAGFGDRDIPANQFLNQNGGTIIVVLAGLAMSSGIRAMILDQREQRSADSKDTADDA